MRFTQEAYDIIKDALIAYYDNKKDDPFIEDDDKEKLLVEIENATQEVSVVGTY